MTLPKRELVSIHPFAKKPQSSRLNAARRLTGFGWAANAVGGAWEIYRWGGWLNDSRLQEPTWFYLEHLAAKRSRAGLTEWRDIEGSVIGRKERSPTP